jgi:cytochrome c oxidase assembly protein subunit 15
MASRYSPALHRYAVFTAAATLFLLLAGALVTSNDAGLAVPDWPLSYGSLLPPMVGGIFYEHGHRMVATFVGMLTIGLAVWLWRSPATAGRRGLRWLGTAALALVIFQGLLGGLTVLFFLPTIVSVSHAFTAQLFFATVVSLAVFTSRWWVEAGESGEGRGERAEEGRNQKSEIRDEEPGRVSPAAFRISSFEFRLRWLSVATVAAIFVQLVLGAAFRHKAFGITPHIVWAAVVAFLIIWTAQTVSKIEKRKANSDSFELNGANSSSDFRFSLFAFRVRPLRRLSRILVALLGVQLLLGLGAWWAVVATRDFPQPMPVMVWSTVAHVVTGAALLAVAVILALCCHRITNSEMRKTKSGAELAPQAVTGPVTGNTGNVFRFSLFAFRMGNRR